MISTLYVGFECFQQGKMYYSPVTTRLIQPINKNITNSLEQKVKARDKMVYLPLRLAESNCASTINNDKLCRISLSIYFISGSNLYQNLLRLVSNAKHLVDDD